MAKLKVCDVHAVWCGPCRFYGPIFEKVSKREDMQDVEFEKVDADEDEEFCTKHNIRNIPTTLIFNAETGEVITRLLGAQSEENLVSAINTAKAV